MKRNATFSAPAIGASPWWFVYGSRPSTEAALGARAAQTGADCLVIDAESGYEGRYAQAQAYLRALRARIPARRRGPQRSRFNAPIARATSTSAIFTASAIPYGVS